MTRDEIIRMAREADREWDGDRWMVEWLINFAALVAAAEREACAQVCDEKVGAEYATGKVDHNEMGWTQYCAMAIRLRESEQK